MTPIIQPQSVTEQVAEHLADQIVQERLSGGQRIQEQPWAARLGVSRGSVREALLLLERRHLVVIEPRRGARVVPLNAQWAREIAQAWFLVLGAILDQLARKPDPSDLSELREGLAKMERSQRDGDTEGFYRASMQLATAAGRLARHRIYQRLLSSLMPAARRCFYHMLKHEPDQHLSTLGFAENLVAALESGDRTTARNLLDAFAAREIGHLEAALATKA